jgi:hypothetical protein
VAENKGVNEMGKLGRPKFGKKSLAQQAVEWANADDDRSDADAARQFKIGAGRVSHMRAKIRAKIRVKEILKD